MVRYRCYIYDETPAELLFDVVVLGMAEEKIKELEGVVEEVAEEVAAAVPVAPTEAPAQTQRGRRGRGGERSKNVRRGGRRGEFGKSGLDERIISIRRVARVVAGGRRFSFSVSLIVGDRKGSVAVGIGKGADTALAIDKAVNNAKKHLRKFTLTKEMSIPHEVMAKFNASRVVIMPAPGRGLTAGSSVRHVLEIAGIKNVSAKLLSRSKNQLNNARAAVRALETLRG